MYPELGIIIFFSPQTFEITKLQISLQSNHFLIYLIWPSNLPVSLYGIVTYASRNVNVADF